MVTHGISRRSIILAATVVLPLADPPQIPITYLKSEYIYFLNLNNFRRKRVRNGVFRESWSGVKWGRQKMIEKRKEINQRLLHVPSFLIVPWWPSFCVDFLNGEKLLTFSQRLEISLPHGSSYPDDFSHWSALDWSTNFYIFTNHNTDKKVFVNGTAAEWHADIERERRR